MVVHFVPVQRCRQLVESLTGTAPSAGFVHGMLARAAALLDEADKRIRALLTAAYVVCADETPLRIGPATPAAGRKKAVRYLLVACSSLVTHYLVGGRDLDTFKAMVVAELAAGSVIVHDRYQNYGSEPFARLLHQLCAAHLLRDLAGAGEIYPDEHWPAQVADALRGLIHQANLARQAGAAAIEQTVKDDLVHVFRQGVLVGLKPPTSTAAGPASARHGCCWKPCAIATPTCCASSTTCGYLEPGRTGPATLEVQQNISGRPTSEDRARQRYKILGYVSTAAKHGLNQMTVLRDAFLGRPWIPDPTT
jgi:transposase